MVISNVLLEIMDTLYIFRCRKWKNSQPNKNKLISLRFMGNAMSVLNRCPLIFLCEAEDELLKRNFNYAATRESWPMRQRFGASWPMRRIVKTVVRKLWRWVNTMSPIRLKTDGTWYGYITCIKCNVTANKSHRCLTKTNSVMIKSF